MTNAQQHSELSRTWSIELLATAAHRDPRRVRQKHNARAHERRCGVPVDHRVGRQHQARVIVDTVQEILEEFSVVRMFDRLLQHDCLETFARDKERIKWKRNLEHNADSNVEFECRHGDQSRQR